MRIAFKYNKDKEKENTCLENLSTATKEGDRKSTIKKRSFSHTHNIISPSTPNLSTLFNSYTFTHYFFFFFATTILLSYWYLLIPLHPFGFSSLGHHSLFIFVIFGTKTIPSHSLLWHNYPPTHPLSLSLGVSHLWQGYYLTHDPLRQHSLWSWSLS